MGSNWVAETFGSGYCDHLSTLGSLLMHASHRKPFVFFETSTILASVESSMSELGNEISRERSMVSSSKLDIRSAQLCVNWLWGERDLGRFPLSREPPPHLRGERLVLPTRSLPYLRGDWLVLAVCSLPRLHGERLVLAVCFLLHLRGERLVLAVCFLPRLCGEQLVLPVRGFGSLLSCCSSSEPEGSASWDEMLALWRAYLSFKVSTSVRRASKRSERLFKSEMTSLLLDSAIPLLQFTSELRNRPRRQGCMRII